MPETLPRLVHHGQGDQQIGHQIPRDAHHLVAEESRILPNQKHSPDKQGESCRETNVQKRLIPSRRRMRMSATAAASGGRGVEMFLLFMSLTIHRFIPFIVRCVGRKLRFLPRNS